MVATRCRLLEKTRNDILHLRDLNLFNVYDSKNLVGESAKKYAVRLGSLKSSVLAAVAVHSMDVYDRNLRLLGT